MKDNNKNQRGLGLVELLVAIFIITTLSLIVVGMSILTTRLVASSEHKALAIALVNEQLDFRRAQLFDDVPVGQDITTEIRNLTPNDQTYTVTTDVVEVNDPLSPDPDIDYKEVTIKVEWSLPDGGTREASGVTFLTKDPRPFDCGGCGVGQSCDFTVGVCLPDTPPGNDPMASDCEPGLFCPDGGPCPVTRDCSVSTGPLPLPTTLGGGACKPGDRCTNGALCPIAGLCPDTSCVVDPCAAGDTCLEGWCYGQEWYDLSFANYDGSGLRGQKPQCELPECVTSDDCPVSAQFDDITVIWRCEDVWIPQCRVSTLQGGGSSKMCLGTYDSSGICSGTEVSPIACPDPSLDPDRAYCDNGVECHLSSTDAACSLDEDCESGEMCNGAGFCRTICPNTATDASVMWGGYNKGCRPHIVKGVLDQPGAGTVGAGQSDLTLSIEHAGPDQSQPFEILEGDSGLTPVTLTATLSDTPIDRVEAQLQVQAISAGFLADDVGASQPIIVFDRTTPLTQSIIFNVNGDTTEEEHDEFEVSPGTILSNAHNVTSTSNSKITILNDDVTVNVLPDSMSPETDVEGGISTTATSTFVVERRGATSGSNDGVTLLPLTVTATVSTNAGLATFPTDYDAKAEDFTFPPGATISDVQNFVVDIVGDNVPEKDENYGAVVTTTNVDIGTSGNALIIDDDNFVDLVVGTDASSGNASPIFEAVTIGGVPVDQNLGFYVQTKFKAAQNTITGIIQTSDGTAIDGQDYTGGSYPFTIFTGNWNSSVTVPILNDAIEEIPTIENLSATVTSISGATLGNDTVSAEIIDDDVASGDPYFTISDMSIVEGDSAIKIGFFWVRRSADAPSTFAPPYLHVDFATASGTAGTSDYISDSRPIYFPGNLKHTLQSVFIWGDTIIENPYETFNGVISNPSDPTYSIQRGTGVATIIDDDY